jgi:hypothetical protein
MSAFESKAKTTAQIYHGYDTCDYANYHATQKWLTLEQVIKIDNEHEAAYDKAAQTANDYCVKVCELLQFLEELKKSAQPQSCMWQAGFSHAFDNVEHKVKKLFPNRIALEAPAVDKSEKILNSLKNAEFQSPWEEPKA